MQAPAKCTVLLLLLAGLLVAGTKGYPSQYALPVQQQDLSAVVKGWPDISQESLQDNTNEDLKNQIGSQDSEGWVFFTEYILKHQSTNGILAYLPHRCKDAAPIDLLI